MSDDKPTRPGEVTVELPGAFDTGLYFIGHIYTPWKSRDDCPKNNGESDRECTIEIDPRYAAALRDVGTASHLLVLYYMDRARRDLLVQAPKHYKNPHGTFALRSPARPNPIAVSVVKLLHLEGTRLHVVGLDCVDNTPLLDIKPYFASTDSVPGAIVGWHQAEKS